MSLIKRLFSWADREEPVYLETSRRYAFLDANEWRTNLLLEAKAKSRGEINQPSPDDSTFDEVEKSVTRVLDEAKARAVEQFWSDIKADNASIASIDIENQIGLIKSKGREALAHFKVDGSTGFGVLEELKRVFTQKKDELRRFAETNGLTRQPVQRSGGAKVLQIGFVVLFAVGEWLANSVLLGENQAGGFISGGVIATVIAALNIAPAWLTGSFFWRMTNHLRPAVYLRGYLGVVIWLIWVTVFNLGAGHYRDAVIAAVGSGNPEALAKQAFIDHPFSLNDVKSYTLLFLGIGTAALVALDAYFFDDTYPGYGAIGRARDDALEDFHETKKSIQVNLKESLDAALREMEVARKSAGSLLATHANAMVRRQATKHQFSQYLDHLESVGRDLLSYYRTTNRSYRSTPAPAHFGTQYVLGRGDVPEAGDAPTMPTARLQELVTEATRTVDEASALLTDEFTKQAEAYARVEDII